MGYIVTIQRGAIYQINTKRVLVSGSSRDECEAMLKQSHPGWQMAEFVKVTESVWEL